MRVKTYIFLRAEALPVYAKRSTIIRFFCAGGVPARKNKNLKKKFKNSKKIKTLGIRRRRRRGSGRRACARGRRHRSRLPPPHRHQWGWHGSGRCRSWPPPPRGRSRQGWRRSSYHGAEDAAPGHFLVVVVIGGGGTDPRAWRPDLPPRCPPPDPHRGGRGRGICLQTNPTRNLRVSSSTICNGFPSRTVQRSPTDR